MSATHQTASSKYSLPTRPSLAYLRKEAKRRLAKLRTGGASVQLADVQFLIAREHGFSSWRALKAAIENSKEPVQTGRSPLNQHALPSRFLKASDRIGLENIFFNAIAASMFLACLAMTADFGKQRIRPLPDWMPVIVEIGR